MKHPALFLATLMTWAGFSHASDTRYDAFMQRVVGNSTTVTFGTNGVPIATSSAPLGTPAVRNSGWTNTAEGVFLESNGSARLPDGRGTVPVTSKIKASAPVIGRALYRGAAALSVLGVGWQAGEELYDIWADLGYAASPSGPAMPSSTASPSTGLEYRLCENPNQTGCSTTVGAPTNQFWSPWYFSAQAVCSAHQTFQQSLRPNSPVYTQLEGNSCITRFVSNNNFVSGAVPSTRTSPTCPTGFFVLGNTCTQTQPVEPLSEQDFLDEIATQSGWPSRTAQALARAANIAGVGRDLADDLEALPETETSVQFRTGTPSIQVGEPIVEEEVTTNPDGSTSTRTTTRTSTATTTGNQIRQSEETTTVVTTRDSTGTVTGVTTSTTTATTPGTDPQSSPSEDLIVCGLPDTPPCKIDETGTSEPLPDDGQTIAETILQTLQACADDLAACLPAMPDISWTFSLPTGCAPIVLGGGFETYVEPIDICEWQPMFHDLMSMIWAGVGLFGAVALFRPRG